MSNSYYSKQYTGNKIITWKNFTDTSTPLSAANLQKSHSAINDMDNEVYAAFQLVDQTKMDKADAGSMLAGIDYYENTGTFVFHYFDSTEHPDFRINTNLEKIVVNFSYNPLTQKLELVQSDGTTVEVDLSAFVANPDLVDSTEIHWTINASGQISASIKNNSITDEKMQPNYLADITEQAGNAEASAETAEYNAKLAKYYMEQAQDAADEASHYNSPFTGATSSADGSVGLVPKPLIADRNKFLKADGGWADVPSPSDFTGATSQSAGAHGLVPAPTVADKDKFLKGDGGWATVPNPQTMTGATSSADGEGGLVPKPLAGDNEKFFSGDGTYKKIPQTSASIADTETSPATYAHSVDEQFFYNDILYTVISAISIGDSLTVGTNIQASDTIVDQLGNHKGHEIKNSSGTSLTDRTALQFENGYVEDDSVNDKTVVKSTNFIGTQSEWDALSANEQSKYTSKDITDDVIYNSDLFKVVNGVLHIGYYVTT